MAKKKNLRDDWDETLSDNGLEVCYESQTFNTLNLSENSHSQKLLKYHWVDSYFLDKLKLSRRDRLIIELHLEGRTRSEIFAVQRKTRFTGRYKNERSVDKAIERILLIIDNWRPPEPPKFYRLTWEKHAKDATIVSIRQAAEQRHDDLEVDDLVLINDCINADLDTKLTLELVDGRITYRKKSR